MRLTSLGLFLVTLSAAAGAWPPASPDLAVDPSIHFGELPNGFRYALKRQPIPPGTTSLRLVVRAGSLHEEAGEEGLAHFVEHMAFNGTTRFPGESLAAVLEEQGIRWGPDLTAFTWPSHTIYQLDLNNSAPAKLDLALRVMREWAGEIRFAPDQVERERGVLLAEFQARGANNARIHQQRMDFTYPESRLSDHTPIATTAQINTATAADLRRFFQRWYRPDNMIFVVAGDIDPTAFAERIAAVFGDLPRPADPLPPLDLGRIANNASTRVHLVPNDEIKTFNVELILVEPTTPVLTAVEYRREVALGLAVRALQRRLNVLSRTRPGLFGTLTARLNQDTPHAREFVLHTEGRTTDWKELLATAIDEYRRLRRYGLLDAEIAPLKADALKRAEHAARYAATETAAGAAGRIAGQLVWGNIPTSPDYNYEQAAALLPEIDAAECLAALRPLFAAGFPGFLVISEISGMIGHRSLTEYLNEVSRRPLDRPAPPPEAVFPYTDFGPPGEIVERRHDASLDVHMIRFANGVMLNLKRTAFDARSAYLTARLDSGGILTEPAPRHGVAMLAQGTLIGGSLGRLDIDQLQAALSGHFVRLGFEVNETTLDFNGSADTDDLELLLQLLCAYLTDSALTEDAFVLARESILIWTGMTERFPESALAAKSNHIYYLNDVRFSVPDPTVLRSIDPAEVRAWVKPQLMAAPIEVGLVGDFDVETALQFAAATLGALPAREPVPPPPPTALRRDGGEARFRIDSGESKAGVLVAWPVTGLETARRRRTMELLMWTLRSGLNNRIREELGLTYVPDCDYWISEAVEGRGFLQIKLSADTRDLQTVYDNVLALATELADGGITAEAVRRAREPVLQGIDAQLQSNGYWVRYVASAAQTDPEALVIPHTRRSDIESITQEEIQALAREVIVPTSMLVMSAVP